MALMTLQQITAAGLTPLVYAPANIQDTIEGGGSDRVFLHVKDGGGAPITVTIAALRVTAEVPGVGPVTVPDIVVVVGNGDEALIGPINSAYADADGTITVDYSDVTSVTSAAFKLAKGQ